MRLAAGIIAVCIGVLVMVVYQQANVTKTRDRRYRANDRAEYRNYQNIGLKKIKKRGGRSKHQRPPDEGSSYQRPEI